MHHRANGKNAMLRYGNLYLLNSKGCIDNMMSIVQSCPAWREWTLWGVCSEACGGGLQTRRRMCVGGVYGQVGCDLGSTSEERFCNSQVIIELVLNKNVVLNCPFL